MNDNSRTTKLPTVPPPRNAGFAITEELPAAVVQQPGPAGTLPPSRRRGSSALRVPLLILAVVLVAVATLLVVQQLGLRDQTNSDDPVGTIEEPTDPVEAPSEPEPVPSEPTDPEPEPEPVSLANEGPGVWQVSGTSNLNVRSGPGTSAEIIGSISGDDIQSTGERAEVNGSEWKQIVLDDTTLGWVAANFLAPDALNQPDE